jgi:hypothetical protein
MTAQSIVCRTCAASVPYGRLSCPNCGELLASVAGAKRGGARSLASKGVAAARGAASRRSAGRAPASASAPAPEVLYDGVAAPSTALVEGPLAADDVVSEPETDWPAAANLDDAPLALGHYGNGVEDDEDLEGLIRDDDDPVEVEPTTTAGHAWAVAGASLTGPATPAYMPRPRFARTTDEAVAVEAAAPATPAPALPAEAPGAYVPPLPVVSIPAGPAVPARAWGGQGNGTHPESDPASPSTKTPGDRLMDASRLAEFVGSVSIAGSALAAVGFLLPWASVMIGSDGVGYFDRWGLAGPAHILVVLAILAILVLAVVRNPIPTWIRTGLAGLGVGALLLGLTWPYLLGPLDAAPGVLIAAIGAIALIGSGLLALVTDRHAEANRAV